MTEQHVLDGLEDASLTRWRHDVRGMTEIKPPAMLSTAAEYHTAPEWHVCAVFSWTYLCRSKQAHEHGCSGRESEAER
jgi:hypothetical protein